MKSIVVILFLSILPLVFSQSPDTLYPVKVHTENGYKFGYINNQGYLSIKPQFAFAKDFSEGLAFVKNEIESDKWICINTAGLVVFELQAIYVKDFSNGAARYLDSTKKVYAVGFSGELISNPLEEKPIYCGKWTRYSFDGRYGFFNVDTYDSLPAVYLRAGNFCQGPAPVFISFNESDLPEFNCYNAFINEEGEVIIRAELKYDDKGYLESGYFYSPDKWVNGVCRYYTSNDPATRVEKYIRSDGKVIW
ncbi:MAG TPA: WG repeat-containing protein [Ignavibacteria bacterium]|nr:WG repeat-containing protein [Ignavibacteria bacterium]